MLGVQPKRGRGRPKIYCNVPVVPSDGPRGRGRPRKTIKVCIPAPPPPPTPPPAPPRDFSLRTNNNEPIVIAPLDSDSDCIVIDDDEDSDDEWTPDGGTTRQGKSNFARNLKKSITSNLEMFANRRKNSQVAPEQEVEEPMESPDSPPRDQLRAQNR